MPFSMTPEKASLRARFERCLLAELARVGPAGFRRHEMIDRWANTGAGRSTLWRWLREMLQDPAGAGQHLIPKPTPQVRLTGQSAGDRAGAVSVAVDAGAAADTQEQQVMRLDQPSDTRPPPVESPTSGSVFNILEGLQGCITAATAVIERARDAINDQASARTVIMASEHLRKSMETAIRLHDAIWNVHRIEQFHGAIIEAVQQESPAAAARILEQLQAIAHNWANPKSREGPPDKW